MTREMEDLKAAARTPNEQFYDDEIAPVLVTLAAKCQSRDIPFLALVQFASDNIGRTEFPGSSPHIEMLVAQFAARARGNVDALIMALMKHGREHGHNSLCLKVLEREP